MDNGKLPAEAIYNSPNGRVRAHYRTAMTAEDDLQRAFVVADYVKPDGRADVPIRVTCEFCLERFCTRLELLDEAGNIEATHVFTRALLAQLTGPYAENGWAAILGVLIYKEVIDKTATVVEAVKKTSESAFEPSTPASTQAAPPSPLSPT